MLSEKEITLLYETLLSAPGMNDVVKLDLRLARKHVLLLTKVIEKGLLIKPADALDGLVRAVGEGSLESLQKVSFDLLQRAGLLHMSEKLQILQPAYKEK